MSVARFTDAQLAEIAKILGDTTAGFTDREIARLLAERGLPDPGEMTKRDRLYQGLREGQARDGSGRHVAMFVQTAMDPVRYASERGAFEGRRDALNVVLAFAGVTLRDDA